MKQIILLLVFVLCCTACNTVTVVKDHESRTSEEPQYHESKSFFFWGLAGEKDLYVQKICQNRPMQQAVFQTTFLDGFLSAITLGIYSPRSVKIWCEDTSSEAGT